MAKRALIIGGGAAGCSAAHQLELMGGWDTTLVEAGPFLGAGVRTFWYGGHPYTFGPRHFLTQNRKVYDYMNAICPLRSCGDHQFITYVERDNAFYNYPIHEDDIAKMPDVEKIKAERKAAVGVAAAKNLEEYWIGSVGRTLYEKFIDQYNKKMWLVDDNSTIDTFNWSPKGVTIKSGPRAAWDSAMSAYPLAKDGYNKFFDITTQGTKVLLSTRIERYELDKSAVWIKGEKHVFDIIINTISPDILYGQCFGELKYIGRDLHKIVFPTEFVLPEHVYWLYYANDEKFTRLVEYKKFTHHKSPTTLVGLEIPSGNGKHYPLPFKSEQVLARKYFDLMPKNLYSIGRAGSYRYGLDIDDCIEQAMIMAQQIKEGGRDYPVPMEVWR
jgi:UDP-galactopyranose mutase